MNCYEFKGGTGTASRVGRNRGGYTVGVLVQANFGSRARARRSRARPLGDDLADDNPLGDGCERRTSAGRRVGRSSIVATDAPLLPHQCAALARRVTLGIGAHRDDRLALLRRPVPRPVDRQPGRVRGAEPRDAEPQAGALRFLLWHKLDPFFEAVVQATEEAILNALVANDDMTGYRGHRVSALPRERVAARYVAR